MQKGVKHLEDTFPHIIFIVIRHAVFIVVEGMLEVNHQGCYIILTCVESRLFDEASPSEELI